MKRFFLILLIFPILNIDLKAENYEKIIDRISAKFVKEICKEKNLYIAGYGGRMMNNIEEVFLSFNTIKNVNLEEARSLYLEIIDRYLAEVNESIQVRPYLHNYPFTYKNLPFHLSFMNENKSWHRNGPITFVMYSKRTDTLIYCTYDDSKNCLEDVYEEPYAEAVRLARQAKG